MVPQTKPDIATRADLERLLEAFYARILDDPEIGYLFTEVAHLDLEKHLPVITDFWETVLLGKARYKGNTLEVHAELHRQSPLEAGHFERWLTVFGATVDELFAGSMSELAKQRARSIATVMQLNLERTRADRR